MSHPPEDKAGELKQIHEDLEQIHELLDEDGQPLPAQSDSESQQDLTDTQADLDVPLLDDFIDRAPLPGEPAANSASDEAIPTREAPEMCASTSQPDSDSGSHADSHEGKAFIDAAIADSHTLAASDQLSPPTESSNSANRPADGPAVADQLLQRLLGSDWRSKIARVADNNGLPPAALDRSLRSAVDAAVQAWLLELLDTHSAALTERLVTHLAEALREAGEAEIGNHGFED